MYSLYTNGVRAVTLKPQTTGYTASPARPESHKARLVKITWDELDSLEGLTGLDDYIIDDIGMSHSEICSRTRKSAEDRRGEHRASI